MTGEKVNFEEAKKASSPARTNERSTIAFPYLDLEVAIEVAKSIFGRAGINTCPLDELAAEMGQTVTSGNFKLKTSACRQFGLADKDGQSGIRLTELGIHVVEEHNFVESKVKAFLNVPLYEQIFSMYRGKMLPPSKALEREMQQLGVSSKQTDKARHAFQRSAEQAGFFGAGKDRLVKPRMPVDTLDRTIDPPEGKEQREAFDPAPPLLRHGGGGSGPPPLDPLISALVSRLPPSGSVWPLNQRKKWLDALATNFDFVYQAEDGEDDRFVD
ncbi:MAG: hypothetical protein MRY59_08620 [Aquisalinus sp.]|nr:hypothetical protein [Aquisalinus sp.]